MTGSPLFSMLTLNLLRHAKSSWTNPELDDFARPLKKRGRNDCLLMANELRYPLSQVGRVYCSSAARARETWQRVSSGAELAVKTDYLPELYTFSTSQLAEVIAARADTAKNILVVGHNPALTGLINRLANADLANLPTCGFARLEFSAANSWRSLMESRCRNFLLLTPKMFK